MNTNHQTEYWLRGPVAGVPLLLQPVAHALLQTQEEVHNILNNFPEELLWQQPAKVASPGFHLQHLSGVLSRLFTYADGKQLTAEQLQALQGEGKADNKINSTHLLYLLDEEINKCINYLKATSVAALTDARLVGRKKMPSTVIGLLFHAAEHTMRHTGQLLVTVQILKESNKQ